MCLLGPSSCFKSFTNSANTYCLLGARHWSHSCEQNRHYTYVPMLSHFTELNLTQSWEESAQQSPHWEGKVQRKATGQPSWSTHVTGNSALAGKSGDSTSSRKGCIREPAREPWKALRLTADLRRLFINKADREKKKSWLVAKERRARTS